MENEFILENLANVPIKAIDKTTNINRLQSKVITLYD